MASRRGKTSTEGNDFSFGFDNLARSEPGADFVKRRLRYPLSDDPRAREIKFDALVGEDSFTVGSDMFRHYRGEFPLEGQDPLNPQRASKLQKPKDLRPELPNRTPNFEANEAAQSEELSTIVASDWQAVYPTTTISQPSPGASYAPGDTILVVATGAALRTIHRGVLSIDGTPVDDRVLDRADQEQTSHEWRFFYTVPSSRVAGPMEITVRTLNMSNASRAIIADNIKEFSPYVENLQGALGTVDGDRKSSSTSSSNYQPLLDTSLYLRTPSGMSSITVNIT